MTQTNSRLENWKRSFFILFILSRLNYILKTESLFYVLLAFNTEQSLTNRESRHIVWVLLQIVRMIREKRLAGNLGHTCFITSNTTSYEM